MSVFDLEGQDEDEYVLEARQTGQRATEITPGFFDGGLTGAGLGVARGAAKVGRGVSLAVGGGLVLAEKLGGYDPGEVTDSYFDSVVKLTDEAVDFYTPDANTVGTVGRVAGGLAEIIAPLAAGGGNPSLLVGSTLLNTSADLVRQGVDPTTAVATGAVDATAIGLGFRLPFVGPTLLTKAASGAGGGLALGGGATALDRTVLQARGYDEVAKQYNPLDLEARTVDLLTGLAFGGLAHLQTGKPIEVARSERDAGLAGLNARHFQNETAPGRPRDEVALAAHQRALETALIQIQEGRPVDVGESRVTEAGFLDAPRETAARDPLVRQALDELGIRDTPEVRDAPDLAVTRDAAVDTPAALGEVKLGQADLPPGRVVTPDTPAPRTEPRRATPEDPAGRSSERAEADDPDVIAAERSLADRDIEIETGNLVDAGDGKQVSETRSARAELAAARQDVESAKKQASAFEAAVACALSFGDV